MNLHPSMPPGQRRYTLLDEAASLVLRAVSLRGPDAVDAFRRWRTLVKLDDAGRAASRVLPLLVELVQREGIDDPDLQRMQGVGRHIWTQNTLNVRLLLAALDALDAAGIRPMLLKGIAQPAPPSFRDFGARNTCKIQRQLGITPNQPETYRGHHVDRRQDWNANLWQG